HTPDPATPISETLATLTDLVAEGKVRHIGNSNFSAGALHEADRVARERGLVPFVSAQNEYSLLARAVEDEVLPAVRELGLGFIPYPPSPRRSRFRPRQHQHVRRRPPPALRRRPPHRGCPAAPLRSRFRRPVRRLRQSLPTLEPDPPERPRLPPRPCRARPPPRSPRRPRRRPAALDPAPRPRPRRLRLPRPGRRATPTPRPAPIPPNPDPPLRRSPRSVHPAPPCPHPRPRGPKNAGRRRHRRDARLERHPRNRPRRPAFQGGHHPGLHHLLRHRSGWSDPPHPRHHDPLARRPRQGLRRPQRNRPRSHLCRPPRPPRPGHPRPRPANRLLRLHPPRLRRPDPPRRRRQAQEAPRPAHLLPRPDALNPPSPAGFRPFPPPRPATARRPLRMALYPSASSAADRTPCSGRSASDSNRGQNRGQSLHCSIFTFRCSLLRPGDSRARTARLMLLRWPSPNCSQIHSQETCVEERINQVNACFRSSVVFMP
ncbi:MAG: aldo/keto reductase, partial [Opitutae bacterium]|nr:aldo/keto reductase [Opitutae bacterium]